MGLSPGGVPVAIRGLLLQRGVHYPRSKRGKGGKRVAFEAPMIQSDTFWVHIKGIYYSIDVDLPLGDQFRG